MSCAEEYWVHLEKVMGLTRDQHKILKKHERGMVVGTQEKILIYERNPTTQNILGGLQCEIVQNDENS